MILSLSVFNLLCHKLNYKKIEELDYMSFLNTVIVFIFIKINMQTKI